MTSGEATVYCIAGQKPENVFCRGHGTHRERGGWHRLVSLCRMLHKARMVYTVEYELKESGNATATLHWAKE